MGGEVWGRDWLDEVRNRATVIEGFAHLLVAGVAPHQTAEHARRILDQAQCLRRLLAVDDCGGPASPVDLRPAPTDVGRLVRGTVAAMDEGSTGTVLVSAPGGPVAGVDARRVAGVLAALLTDAARHLPAGGAIEVDVRGEGGSAAISWRHPGRARGSDEVLDLYRGRAVARAHGGDLTVEESESDTTVTLRLPME